MRVRDSIIVCALVVFAPKSVLFENLFNPVFDICRILTVAKTGCLTPYAYQQVVQAVAMILEEFRPKGDASPKPVGDFAHLPVASYAFARDFLSQLKKSDAKRADAENRSRGT